MEVRRPAARRRSTLVAGPRRSLSLKKLSDTRVYEPQIRALPLQDIWSDGSATTCRTEEAYGNSAGEQMGIARYTEFRHSVSPCCIACGSTLRNAGTRPSTVTVREQGRRTDGYCEVSSYSMELQTEIRLVKPTVSTTVGRKGPYGNSSGEQMGIARSGTYKTVKARFNSTDKTFKSTYKTVKARFNSTYKTVKGTYKTVKARFKQRRGTDGYRKVRFRAKREQLI